MWVYSFVKVITKPQVSVLNEQILLWTLRAWSYHKYVDILSLERSCLYLASGDSSQHLLSQFWQ